jgi:hypothetical protein
MNIYLGAILTKNKAIAAPIVEPFYSSLHSHTIVRNINNGRSKLRFFCGTAIPNRVKIAFYLQNRKNEPIFVEI